MFDPTVWLWGLAPIFVAVLVLWLRSLRLADVSIVDSAWGPLFALAVLAYALALEVPGERVALIVTLVLLWASRLAFYITWRNWGEGEDRRYQAIRARNQPNFAIKSLYLIFGLQGGLAWFISLPLLAAATGQASIGWLDHLGVLLWTIGMLFESVGDWQLARFKAQPGNHGRVLDRGLWGWTRHPNYFGEFCVWWGYYLIALAAGGWWTLPAALLMTWLLLKVSGVSLLEQDLRHRKPAYREYMLRTNTFFPGPRRRLADPTQAWEEHA